MALVCSLRDDDLDAQAAMYLSEALAKNETLQALEYAAARSVSYCQHPLTIVFDSRLQPQLELLWS